MQQENLSCQTIEAFLAKLSECPSPEERISLSLSFMSHSLFRDKVPYFKGFWQAKEKAFETLKEWPSASPLHWAQYKELCEEFHRVKIVIDEEASFAAEQIELALLGFEPLVDKILQGKDLAPASLKAFPVHGNLHALEKAQGAFLAIQSVIGQLSALRQEVLTSTMKVRLKNRLLGSINTLIEKILPFRKERKGEVTLCFIDLVESFVQTHFDEKGALRSMRTPLIQLQKEVKILQALAKELSLTGDGFKKSRALLTPCWNTLRTLHDQYKKKQAAAKAAELQAKKEILSKLELFKQDIASQNINLANMEEKKRTFIAHLKSLQLSRDDMTTCLAEIKTLLQPLYAEEEKIRQVVVKAAASTEAARTEKLNRLRHLIESAIDSSALQEASALFYSLKLSLSERMELEPSFLTFKDEVERKEAASQDMQSLLRGEKIRLQKIRESLDEMKKMGTTFGGADFEQALLYNAALQKHKLRLSHTETVIAALSDQTGARTR